MAQFLIFLVDFVSILDMSPEEHELLKRSIALSEENNDMLRSMKRSMRMAHFMTLIYWIFIIGSAVGAYYLVQPYFDQIKALYGQASSNFSSFNNAIQSFKQVGH